MANFEFRLPDIGEGVTEGEVVTWHVKEGDRVSEDQVMVEVMTDKATVTIGAPRGGKIHRLMADIGHIVKVGDVLVVIQTGNGSRAHSQLPAATAAGEIRDSLPGTNYFGEKRATVQAGAPSSGGSAEAAPAMHEARAPSSGNGAYYDEKPLATPATRKRARELKVDLHRVPPTGPGGRVTQADIEAYSSAGTLSAPSLGGAREPAPVAPRARSSAQARAQAPLPGTRVPFVGLRRRIAENMSLSKNTAAHFSFVEECDCDRLIELRDRLRPDAQGAGVDLTYLPFVVKAVVAALKKHPMLNSSLDVERNEVVLHEGCNIGIAAATESGLVVPVIHQAQSLSLLELASEINRLGAAARDGKLSVSELSGSTFTVTSLGRQAGLFAVPIINYPNVGILGIHRIKERAVVRDGEIAVGRVMLLSLSMDHRIVDGHVGAAFAYEVIRYLEEPARLLL